jgi:hypothetical protein
MKKLKTSLTNKKFSSEPVKQIKFYHRSYFFCWKIFSHPGTTYVQDFRPPDGDQGPCGLGKNDICSQHKLKPRNFKTFLSENLAQFYFLCPNPTPQIPNTMNTIKVLSVFGTDSEMGSLTVW